MYFSLRKSNFHYEYICFVSKMQFSKCFPIVAKSGWGEGYMSLSLFLFNPAVQPVAKKQLNLSTTRSCRGGSWFYWIARALSTSNFTTLGLLDLFSFVKRRRRTQDATEAVRSAWPHIQSELPGRTGLSNVFSHLNYHDQIFGPWVFRCPTHEEKHLCLFVLPHMLECK